MGNKETRIGILENKLKVIEHCIRELQAKTTLNESCANVCDDCFFKKPHESCTNDDSLVVGSECADVKGSSRHKSSLKEEESCANSDKVLKYYCDYKCEGCK